MHQRLIKMLESLPEGAEVKTTLLSRHRPKLYAVKDGKIYFYTNGKWRKEK